MSGKRSLQSHPVDNLNGIKKPRQDFDEFKAPPSKPGFSYRPSVNSFHPRNPPVVNPYTNTKKIVIPPPPSIVDKDLVIDALLDDDMDEIFIIASQSTEDNEEKFNQQRQMVAEELNYSSFNRFSSNAAGTSTQFTKTGYTEQVRNDLFVDLTVQSQVNYSKTSSTTSHTLEPATTSKPFLRPPLQSKTIPPKYPNTESDGSSQKENISKQQELTKQSNQIKALQIQLSKLKVEKTELHEQVLGKTGEVSNLRRDKKILEDQIKTMKMQKLKETELIKEDPEKERLRKENKSLKTKLEFRSLDESFSRNTRADVQQNKHKLQSPFTNFGIESSTQLQSVPLKAFEVEELLKNRNEPIRIALEREASHNVVKTQLKLAQVTAQLFAGGFIDDVAVDLLFTDAKFMILHISNFIDYLEAGEEDDITFDSDPALTACTVISIPCFREKLTKFDALLNILNKDDGFLTVFQAEKLYPEELCTKPRRIIASYAVIARNSREFCKKLLLENVLNEDAESFQTFVSVLVNSLMLRISVSKNVFDYFGVAIACASLLASLSSHYSDYSSSDIIDDILMRFFRAILECQCDTPVLMNYLSEFLVNITKNPHRTELASKLCVNFPSSKINTSKMYKYSQYPQNACSFQMFLIYILTTFNFDRQLNRHELELLLKTTLNLHCIVSNIQEMPTGTLHFLDRDENSIPSNCCSCFSTLTYAILKLNHLALAHRNENYEQIFPFVHETSSTISNLPILKDKTEFNKYHAYMSEITKGCITCVADLFERIESFTDFPLENLVFSGPLEQLCCWIKYGKCQDKQKKTISCWKAYDCGSYADSFNIINIHPNYLVTFENESEAMEFSDCDSHQVIFKVERCRKLVNDEMDDDAM